MNEDSGYGVAALLDDIRVTALQDKRFTRSSTSRRISPVSYNVFVLIHQIILTHKLFTFYYVLKIQKFALNIHLMGYIEY